MSDEIKFDATTFLELVTIMRDLQTRYYAGQRTLLGDAKKSEQQVDKFIQKVFSDAGTTKEKWEARPRPVEQKKLF